MDGGKKELNVGWACLGVSRAAYGTSKRKLSSAISTSALMIDENKRRMNSILEQRAQFSRTPLTVADQVVDRLQAVL